MWSMNVMHIAVHNTQHKCELRAEVKGSRQRTGELTLIFGGIEVDLHDAAGTNGDAGRGMYCLVLALSFEI